MGGIIMKRFNERNEKLESVFNRVASTFDSIGPNYFSYFGQKMVEHAAIQGGSKILDIAFGRGASLFPAAECAGVNGQIVGIDFSHEMVNQTARTILENDISNIRVMQMDAEKLDFDDETFDNVICGLSTAFFSDSLLAVDEMVRVLKHGGTLGISSWKKRENIGVIGRAYAKLYPKTQNSSSASPVIRPDFSTIEGITQVFENAGLKDIEVKVEQKIFYYKDEAEWWQEQWTNASRGLFERLESLGVIEEFKRFAFIEVQEHKDEHGIRFEPEVLFAFGTK
jgi:ubiquinone/menaquinone biosynthesis C-methylase UbiE